MIDNPKLPPGATPSDGIAPEYKPINFPVRVLPEPVARLISRTQEVYGFSPEFSGLMILVVFAVAIGNTHRIQFKRGFTQPAILFAAIIGPPNSVKSPVFEFMTRVLKRRDRQLYAEYTAAKELYEAYEAMSPAERKDSGVVKPPKPKAKQIITSDSTLEGLYQAWEGNPRGMIFLVDELPSWFNNINKFNRGNDTPAYLSLWSGSDISITRRSGPVHIQSPFLCICGGIQTAIVKNLFKGDNASTGLPDRFLFSQIANFDIPLKSLEEIEEDVVIAYETAVERLLDIPFGDSDKPTILDMTDEARAIYIDWSNGPRHRTRLLEEQEASFIRAWGKFDLVALRLSLIVHIMRWALGEIATIGTVDARSVQIALVLTEYFKKQTARVFRLAMDNDVRLSMTAKVRNVYDALPPKFCTKQAIAEAKRFGMSERTVNRLLRNETLFRKADYANYEKLH